MLAMNMSSQRFDIVEYIKKLRGAEASTRTVIWVAGIMGIFGVFFLGVIARGFHWI